MKRFRVKAAGLWLVLAAGVGLADEGQWYAPGQPATPPAAAPTSVPGLLPPAMRGTSGPVNGDQETLWLPARDPIPSSRVIPASGVSEPVTPPVPQTRPEPVGLLGPRLNAGRDPGPLPEIPVVSDVPAQEHPQAAPTPTQTLAEQPPANPPAPLPIPKPVESQPKPADPPMMAIPQRPDSVPPSQARPQPLPQPRPTETPTQPLPQPRPTETPTQPQLESQPELPPAPPELMCPADVLQTGQRGSFNSPPIRLSADYPPARDLIRRGFGHDEITLANGADGGPMNRFFLSGEYLLWWMPGFSTPILATSNANTALNGYLGEPGTAAVIGPGALINSTRSGFRVRGGAWLDDCQSCGIDASFFFLGGRSATSTINSNAFPIITRPVFVPNSVPGTNMPLGENGEAVAVPGILNGTFTVQAQSQLWGADVNLRKSLCTACDTRAEIFAGYRFLSLRESLGMTEDITVIGPGGTRINTMDPVGTHVVVHDQFNTRNYFNGGQIGGLYERRWNRWDVNARASLALGSTHQVLEISGFQVHQQPGIAPMIFNNGGLLAAGPNLGQFSKDRFSVVPELTLNVGYSITNNLRVFAGYNFLLWTNVIRPGDQIDHVVDLTFVPNALPAGFSGQYRPHPLFKQSDLVINGLQIGMEVRW